MDLTITPELVHELHETAQRAAHAGIALTADGWEVITWADQIEVPWPVAITGDDLAEWTEDGLMDDATAQALAESTASGSYGRSYLVLHENGNITTPAASAEVTVVTGAPGDIDDDFNTDLLPDWESAWWFDQTQARLVLSEPTGAFRETGQAESLWITASGRYVVCRQSIHRRSHTLWYELDADQAAELVYVADAERVAELDDPPMLVTAARAARQLADAIVLPAVRRIPDGNLVHRRTDPDHAALAVATAGIISDLVRVRVQRDLRTTRANAARLLVDHVDGNIAEAHRILTSHRAVSRRTVDDLLNS